MSTSKVDPPQCRRDCNSVDDTVPTCRHPCHAQSFDLDAAFRRRFKLYDDEEEAEDCDVVVSPEHSEFSDDYMSMNGSGTALQPGVLDDRLADLSVSSGDSFCLYDLDDEDDRWSVSTLENVDGMEDHNYTDAETATASLVPVEACEFNFSARSSTTTVCRSASLKSTHSSAQPPSPRTKKVVRFADALGLDLESIRHILDASEGRPDFEYLDGRTEVAGVKMKLMVRFSEPGSSVNFLRRVQERKVSLEEVSVDSERRTVGGVIRVANVAYHKEVTVRYSVDNWSTYEDHTASYLPPGGTNTRYDGGLTDTFTFQLQLSPDILARGGRLEFSLRFVAGPDLTFWDSNFGANYGIDCITA